MTINRVLESNSNGVSNDVVSIQTETAKIEPIEILKDTKIDKDESKPSFYTIRQQIVIKLNDRGFETHLDMKPERGGATVDIVAIKGKIRKKKIFLMLAESMAEGELSANLLLISE